MLDLPRAARLVVWGNAALKGAVSPDEALDQIVGADPAHRVTGLPGEADPVGITLVIGQLRASGVSGLRLVLPVPGDPFGLPGPVAVNQLAVELGEAALTVDGPPLALLPTGPAAWTAYDVTRGAMSWLSVAEAEQSLGLEMRAGTETLLRLDVAGGAAAAGAAEPTTLAARGRPRDPLLPPVYPARAQRLLDSAARVAAIADLAARSPGATVSAHEMRERTDVLRRLDAAARRAIEAACNGLL